MAKRPCKHLQKTTDVSLAKLLSHVQMLKKDLRDVLAAYAGFASQLEAQLKQLFQRISIIGKVIQSDQNGETLSTSGVSGAALWESSCINRSLSALSDVLGALAEHRPLVPYRNSKLTHLLQDSIGGDAKLLVMLSVSPTQHFLSETLQTLGFGYTARQIQRNTPHRRSAALKRK